MDHHHQRRLATFGTALAGQGVAAAVVSWAPHACYLSGLCATGGLPIFLLVTPDEWTAILPVSIAVAQPVEDGTVLPYLDTALDRIVSPPDNAVAALATALARLDLTGQRLGVERAHLRAADLPALAGVGKLTEIGPLLTRMRSRKDEAELAQIRANLAVLAAAFESAREAIRPGVTELAVWATMNAEMMARVGAPFPLDGNFASGPRTLEAEPVASNRRLRSGDLVLVDLYPIIAGYCADLTRTFVVGPPTATQTAQHAVLEAALARGAAALGPGVRARDVDAVVRATIAEAGYDAYFPHHSGHGLGLQAQEPPFLIPGDDSPLAAGTVVAIEPGIYHPEVGGMRLEGNYLVTETGAEALSDYPVELIVCP